jgi:pyruvate/2-oxoglutarate dehydrogenase complex dihydrolipoamide dehydrogenase (E3) component
MEIEAVHLLVATGSVPRPLAKLELDGEHVVTPQQLLKSAETIPQVFPDFFFDA